MPISGYWQFWALLAAFFAALTAIFAKVGIENIDSDYATFIRALVIIGVLTVMLTALGKWQTPTTIPVRSWVFLVLSGLATGASWLAYFRALKLGDASRVAPVDKLSMIMVAIFGVVFLGEKLAPMNWLGVGLIFCGVILLSIQV